MSTQESAAEWRQRGQSFAAQAQKAATNDPVVLALLAIYSELRSTASEDSEQSRAMNLLGGRIEDFGDVLNRRLPG